MKKIKVLIFSIEDGEPKQKRFGVMNGGFHAVLPAIYKTKQEVFQAVKQWNYYNQKIGPILSLLS